MRFWRKPESYWCQACGEHCESIEELEEHEAECEDYREARIANEGQELPQCEES